MDLPNEADRLRRKWERERAARLEAERIAETATRELFESLEGLKRTNSELEAVRQVLHREVLELSTPVVQVWDGVLALPIIGTLDANRAQRMMSTLLDEIVAQRAQVVILDVSGVTVMDSAVAQYVIRTAQAARLMGVQPVVSGIRAATAQTLVVLGVDWGAVETRATLRDALRLAMTLVASDEPVGEQSGPPSSGLSP